MGLDRYGLGQVQVQTLDTSASLGYFYMGDGGTATYAVQKHHRQTARA